MSTMVRKMVSVSSGTEPGGSEKQSRLSPGLPAYQQDDLEALYPGKM